MDFKVGDEVIDMRFGEGVVVEVKDAIDTHITHPVGVKFSCGQYSYYTMDGFYREYDNIKSLHHLHEGEVHAV